MGTRTRWAAAMAAGLLLGGCNPCLQTDCAVPAVEVIAKDAQTGAALETFVATAVVDSKTVTFEGPCGGAQAGCKALYTAPVGNARVTVKADGYLDATFEVSLGEDECGVAITQLREVSLQKAGASGQAVVEQKPRVPGC